MRIGFIQDIHGNLEALNAVLNELYNKHRVDYVFCLGDMINYGPNPNEVMEAIYNNNINFIMGEEEYALLYPDLFYPYLNELSRNAAIWTKQQITQPVYEFIQTNQFNAEGADNRCIYGEDFLAVHASVKDILPNNAQYGVYLDNDEQARDNFSYLMANKKPILFHGHTHIPKVYAYNKFMGKTISNSMQSNYMRIKFLPDHYYIINFGSVGFSRDFKPLASYGVLDVEDRTFEIHRTQYDLQTTLKKLESIQAPRKILAWAANGGFRIVD